MDPNKHETMAQLMARRPERINILIQTRRAERGNWYRTVYAAFVRYGSTPLIDAIDERDVSCGAETDEPLLFAKRVRELIAQWPGCHVQCNLSDAHETVLADLRL